MKKIILEYADRILTIALATFTCLGMFLTGMFIRNLICDTVASYDTMIAVFLGSVILTYLAWVLFWNVKYDLSDLLAEEAEREKELQEAIRKREKERNQDVN